MIFTQPPQPDSTERLREKCEVIEIFVEFLKTLTGSNVNELILDAKAAPIGEISLEDPNWFHDNKLKY